MHSDAPHRAATRRGLACAGDSLKCCWDWASAGDAGPCPLVPAASLRHVAAGRILHRVSFARGELPLCQKDAPRAATATTCLRCPNEPRLEAQGSSVMANLPSERATGRFEHGRAANVSRGAWGYSESLWEEIVLGETAPAWAGRALAGGGQQGEAPKQPGSGNCSLDEYFGGFIPLLWIVSRHQEMEHILAIYHEKRNGHPLLTRHWRWCLLP